MRNNNLTVRKKHLLVDYWTKGGETLDRNLSQEVVRIFDPEKCIGLKLIEPSDHFYRTEGRSDHQINENFLTLFMLRILFLQLIVECCNCPYLA
ncbi:hypothetical protein HZH66_015491 [Vespula vulgaris]|uniref:Uncharacterized protein n=1 Tax=Vespula vulgaris TaxID=7454 RepID=A0A834J142_VESVU|nr:hypothetical protein HZH66_015491 [Vespula vulgaris]